jgi:DNA-binding XRE family transcriptional regulator
VPNIMGVLRAEIRRLARKETKTEIARLKKQVVQMRRRIAESRARLVELEKTARRAVAGGPAPRFSGAAGVEGTQIRFSPAWVRKHRGKLGMSRLLYARLLGVSPQTIMGWEQGRARPRRKALEAWRTMRGMGVRELKARVVKGAGLGEGLLGELGGRSVSRTRRRVRRRRVVRRRVRAKKK